MLSIYPRNILKWWPVFLVVKRQYIYTANLQVIRYLLHLSSHPPHRKEHFWLAVHQLRHFCRMLPTFLTNFFLVSCHEFVQFVAVSYSLSGSVISVFTSVQKLHFSLYSAMVWLQFKRMSSSYYLLLNSIFLWKTWLFSFFCSPVHNVVLKTTWSVHLLLNNLAFFHPELFNAVGVDVSSHILWLTWGPPFSFVPDNVRNVNCPP